MVGSDSPDGILPDSVSKVPAGTLVGRHLHYVSKPLTATRESAMAFALQAMRDHSPFRTDFSGRLFELADEIETYLAYGIKPKRQAGATPDLFGPGGEDGDKR